MIIAWVSGTVRGLCSAEQDLETNLYELHAAVKIGVYAEHERAVGDGLHELRHRDFVGGQKDDGGDAGRRAVGRQCRRCITCNHGSWLSTGDSETLEDSACKCETAGSMVYKACVMPSEGDSLVTLYPFLLWRVAVVEKPEVRPVETFWTDRYSGVATPHSRCHTR